MADELRYKRIDRTRRLTGSIERALACLPDMRLGQIIDNAVYMRPDLTASNQIYFIDDESLIRAIDAYVQNRVQNRLDNIVCHERMGDMKLPPKGD